MSFHARFSASQAHRWLKCPGSVTLIEHLHMQGEIEDESSSFAADQGTAAHYLLEVCLRSLLDGEWDVSAKEHLDTQILVEKGEAEIVPSGRYPNAFVVDHVMADGVDLCVNHVRSILESMGSTEGKIPCDVQVDIEANVDLSHLPNHDALGGTADVRISQYCGELHIIDFKYGIGPVYPKDNPQLKIYALGNNVMEQDHPQKVILTVVQPRCTTMAKTVRSWETSAKDLRDWAKEVLSVKVEEALSTDPGLSAGEGQCRWCRAKPRCTAMHDRALQAAREEFATLPDDEEEIEEKIKSLPPSSLGEILDKMAVIRLALATAEQRAIELIEDGEEIDGWELKPGVSRRKWRDDAIENLKKRRIPKKVWMKDQIIGIREFEKIHKGKYKDLVNELTEKTVPSPKLVRSE